MTGLTAEQGVDAHAELKRPLHATLAAIPELDAGNAAHGMHPEAQDQTPTMLRFRMLRECRRRSSQSR